MNTIFFPSGENSGNALKPPYLVTCSRPEPSGLIRYNSKSLVSQWCLLDENRIFFPSIDQVGAKLAHPKLVICLAFEPSAPATHNSIFIGAVRLSLSSPL